MDKLSILLITPHADKKAILEAAIRRHVSTPTVIYTADDIFEAQSKLRNDPAKVVISDFDIGKGRCDQLIKAMKADRELRGSAVMILDSPPERELLIDELVTGQVQFVSDWRDDRVLNHSLVRALNFASHGKKSTFYLRFLAAGDQLIKEGDKAAFVYILKQGRLSAYRIREDKKLVLGAIEPGEFVGEMAYINGEPRTAHVEALTDCELIEIPLGTLDKLLQLRPSWSKSLMLTLAKRLQTANERSGAIES